MLLWKRQHDCNLKCIYNFLTSDESLLRLNKNRYYSMLEHRNDPRSRFTYLLILHTDLCFLLLKQSSNHCELLKNVKKGKNFFFFKLSISLHQHIPNPCAMSCYHPNDSVTYSTPQHKHAASTCWSRCECVPLFRSSFGMPHSGIAAHSGTALTACSSQHVIQRAAAHVTDLWWAWLEKLHFLEL